MIIYNVTLKIDNEIVVDWVKWMKTEHMADVMNTGQFTDCRLCRLLEQDESDGATYAAQYFCEGIQQYNTYIDKYAEAMRKKGNDLFGGRFIAFRTVMEII